MWINTLITVTKTIISITDGAAKEQFKCNILYLEQEDKLGIDN